MILAYCLSAILVALLCLGIKKIPPLWNIMVFCLIVLIMSSYWAIYGNVLNFSWFVFAKFYTIFGSIIFFQWLQLTDFKPVYGKIIYGILAINILEASVSDMTRFSIINGIAGILLIISQPLPKTVTVDKMSRQVIYPTSWYWIVSYTLWNFTFFYGDQRINSIPLIVLHLGIPFLLSIPNATSYVENRAYALAFTLFLWVFPPSRAYLDWSGSFFQPQVWNVLCWSSLIVANLLALSTLKNGHSILRQPIA